MPPRPATASAHHPTGAELIDCAFPDRLLKAAEDEETESNFLAVLRGCGAAEVAYKDKVGWTVLFEMAYSHDWPKAAAAVIERGCDVHAREKGQTALHWAGGRNRMETARVLLEHGADRTRKDLLGRTAAEFAWENGHAAVAAFLEGSAPPLPPKPTPATAKPGAGARRALPAPASPTLAPQRHRDQFVAVVGGDAQGGALRPPSEVAGRRGLEPAGADTAAGVVDRRTERAAPPLQLGRQAAAAAAWCEAVGADSVAVIREGARAPPSQTRSSRCRPSRGSSSCRSSQRAVGVAAAAAEPGAVRVAESAAVGLAADDGPAGLSGDC